MTSCSPNATMDATKIPPPKMMNGVCGDTQEKYEKQKDFPVKGIMALRIWPCDSLLLLLQNKYNT